MNVGVVVMGVIDFVGSVVPDDVFGVVVTEVVVGVVVIDVVVSVTVTDDIFGVVNVLGGVVCLIVFCSYHS